MAIRTKKRRSFVFKGRDFVFYYDEPWSLHAASNDKQFAVILYLLFTPWDPQPVDCLPLKVIGKEFPMLTRDGQQDVFLRFPRDRQVDYYKPSGVRHLLEWCFSSDKEVIFLRKDHFSLPV
jgi:hypothetical protein